MKKMLLSFGLALFSAFSFSQVIFTVEEPASIAGSKNFTYTNGWAADMNDPANAVLDTVVLADDSLACSALTNGVDLTGQIALIYRGTCEFGAKALAAQNAGAIAVIIVNNIAGAPIAMGAGAVGGSVTIPTVMISQADGEAIHDAMEAGDDVIVFIGNKSDYYADDLGFYAKNVLRVNGNAIPSLLAQNATEFNTELGGWVYNYGSNDQTNITLNVTVNNGADVYDNTSTAFNLLSGDSAYIAMPDFNLASYPVGDYTLTYEVSNGVTDEYIGDNTVNIDFFVNDSIFSLCRLNAQKMPVSDGGIRPSTNNNSYSSCIVFSNANGSRLAAAGMYFNASTATDDSLTGQEIEITAYRWDDAFVDLNDANYGYTSLNSMASGNYYFDSNDQNVPKYQSFTQPFVMEDNQRYLFCATTYNTSVFLGYDTETSYLLNEGNDLQPLYPVESDNAYSAGFEGGDVPSLSVRVFDANDLAVNENVIETSSFPNPAKDVVTVKLNANGKATLKVTDLSGRLVNAEEVSIANGQFTTNVAAFKAGTYVFSLTYADGTSSQFKVVVTK
ncbi:MAG: PA domain-containing protein [Bacteroidota bacterium]